MLEAQGAVLSWPQRRGSRRLVRKTTDAAYRTRLMIVIHTAAGKSKMEIADALARSTSTVDRVRRRWRWDGVDRLADHRATNGQPKVNDTYIETLWDMLQGSPPDHDYDRPGRRNE